MRIYVTKLIGFILALSFTSPGLFAGPLVAPLTFQHAIQDLSTPDDIARFMKDNFIFKDDEPLFGDADYWQSPEEFWDRREGDCEDFALFAKRIFDMHGIEAHVVSFYGDANFAHTVTVFKNEEGRFNVINEDRLYRYKSKTIEEALSQIYPAWNWGGIAEKRGTRGWMVKRLTNPDYQANLIAEIDGSGFSDFPEYFF